MRIGSLVYAVDSGLGVLGKAFHDHGVVTDVMVVRHGRHPEHDEWYSGSPRIADLRRDVPMMEDFCRSMDAMLFFETPFRWELIDVCRAAGVKTALMPMHECLHERVWHHQPDLWLCPSDLDYAVAAKRATGKVVRLNVPVEVPWRLRQRAEVFIHNAGHGGLKGRNGTHELLDAIQYIPSPARFILRGQGESLYNAMPDGCTAFADDRVDVYHGNEKYGDLFAEGDVFVFVEKFNGLSLPLQEARAAGMLVIAADRFPMNRWLPPHALVPVKDYRKNRIGPPYHEFDEAIIDPRDIAATIDSWYGCDISEYSLSGKVWAQCNSWEALAPSYLEVLAR